MSDYILVQTTLSEREDAMRLAKSITGAKLTACTQIDGPIQSVYWWKEKLESEEEWRCTFKTKRLLYAELEAKIKEIHPYETPEIIAIPIIEGSPDFLKWIDEEVKS
ncbi:MAG: divalent-cation tolerance protein CutA [Proteobacteria bacterium]|nr:divalent-cation tolerance protein CutA [Pseudomonadota bacterium]